MSERRKRKSFWDTEEETKHLSGMNEPNSWSGREHHCNYDDRRYHGVSSSGTSSIQKSMDNSGRASWETNEENPTLLMGDGFVRRRQDASEVKEIGGISRYYKDMSPGFDRTERRNCNNSFEDDRSHTRRYPARGRSRSRGRTSGRSRSRSLSRGRGRERERGRGWSRSRSRSTDSARGQSRSRSPVEEYRRQSYGWSDRTRGPDKSSQSCRDFVAGSCRRGSQCRFLHPSNISHRDGDHLEDDPAESWRNKVDRIRTSKHAYNRGPEYEMQDDESEPNRGKCDQFLTKNRNAFPCKDFMRGNCRWADSCKFSHHSTSGESFGKSSSVRSFDNGHQSNQYEKPICKFFAAGKCDRNNCKFSHEVINHEVINKGGLHDKSNWSDNATRVLDAANTVRCDEKNVADKKSTGDTSNEVGTGMESEDKTWGIPEWEERPSNREKQPSPPRESSSHDRGIGYTASMVKADKLEQLILLNSQLQNQDEFLNVQQRNSLQGDHSFSVKALQQNASTSHIQQQHLEMLQNDLVNQFVSDVLDGVKNSQKTTHPDFFPGQSLNENGERIFPGHSSISNETIRGRNMLYPMPSNDVVADLNLPETKIVPPLNLQAEFQNHQKSIISPKMSESKVLQFFPNLLTNEQSTIVTNSAVVIPDQPVAHATENPATFLGQRFVNEQAQAYQSIDPSNSSEVMPSFSDTRLHVPLVNTMNAQRNPVMFSHDLFNPLENGRDGGELSNRCLVPETEQNSQIHVKQSSPLSVCLKIDNLKVNHQENVTVKQDEVAARPENEALGEQSKDDKENKASETIDGHGKNEGGNSTKDDKGMRLFKNTLVEFVKEILKPTWKEGRMSREVHKTVVKKVVDKVTGTMQADHIPKTQEKVEHYLSCCEPKITRLVQAYVERCRKAES